MEAVFYSWLGVAAFAPFITILSTWNLVVFFSYRKRWKLTDLFLLALSSHEIVCSLFGFGFAVLSVIRPLLESPCAFMIWGLTATRTFHIAAITSLLLDQVLTVKWPQTYRYSVQKGQLKYHIVVLSIIALFVGVTAVFARVPTASSGICSIHPLSWDFKFSLFLVSVYSMLMLTGFACCLTVVSRKSDAKQSPKTAVGLSSGRSSRSSNASDGQRIISVENPDDRWRTISSVSWLSLVVNHVPFLVMSLLGIIVPTFWSAWLDNCTVWLSLMQGLLLPSVLFISDSTYRTAVKNMFRPPGRIYRHLSDQSGFWMQVADTKGSKAEFPGPMMMFPSTSCLSLNSGFHVPQRIRWTPNTMASLQSLNLDTRHNNILCNSSEESELDPSSRCVSPVPPIYSSRPSSSCYTLPSLGSCSSAFKDKSDDAISITTNALDDFEFHGVTNNADKTLNNAETRRCEIHCKRSNRPDIVDLIADVPVVKTRKLSDKYDTDSLNTLEGNLNIIHSQSSSIKDSRKMNNCSHSSKDRYPWKRSMSEDYLETRKDQPCYSVQPYSNRSSTRTLPMTLTKDQDSVQTYYKGFVEREIVFSEYL